MTEQSAENDVLVEAGVITTCREEMGDGERCPEPAEFVLWGKLLPPEALGPRCYGHATEHTSWTMPSRPSQWAVIDLRPFRRMFEARVLPPDEPTVCIAHGRFIPCRKDGEHRYTSNPYWVKSVRDYQGSTDEALTWEPAWERVFPPAKPSGGDR